LKSKRTRIIKANAAIAQPTLAAEITLPAGYKFVEAADYCRVMATQQIRNGRPVVVIHVAITASKHLLDPVFVHVEDDPVFERVQVRPAVKPPTSIDGFIRA
jgi:hypothetical protein